MSASDKTAADADDLPIHYRNVLVRVYHNAGLEPHRIVRDIKERPSPILSDDALPVREIVA